MAVGIEGDAPMRGLLMRMVVFSGVVLLSAGYLAIPYLSLPQ